MSAPVQPSDAASEAAAMVKRAAESENTKKTANQLNGTQKAAVFLIAMGVDVASVILKSMRDDEVEKISVEIARLRNVTSDVVEDVLMEYRDMSMAHDYIAQGGVTYARDVLENALGNRRAEEVMMKVEAAMEVSAFHLLQTVETSQLTNFIQNEHPQTAALILSHINSRKAADIISNFEPELQSEIMYRLATMGKTSPELLRDIEEVIRQQIGSVFGGELSTSGGVDKVAEILNSTSHSAERSIIDDIRERNNELASTIKSLMFVFEDLVHIADRDLQRLLMEIEQRELAMALKAASDELKEKVLNNVSERVAAAIREEIDLMGPVRVRDVDEAQRNILDVAHSLEEQEEIVLSSQGDEMIT